MEQQTRHIDAKADLSPELQRTMEASGVGIYSFDPGAGIFIIDATCRRLFDLDEGVPLSPAVMATRIHPDDLQRYWAAAEESMRSGSFALEYRIVHRDGSVHFVSGRASLQPGPAGGPPRIQGVIIDVTARHALEAQLKEAEARMQQLADEVPGLFSYLDRNYVVRFLSGRYDQWYGYSRKRHLNQPIASFISPEAWAKRKPLYDRCLSGETVKYEEARTMANGQEMYYSVTYQPHRDSAGQVVGILSLAMDITERRRIEQELARSNQDLEQFAYVASHDLKAPLRAIEILVDWLREDLTSYTGGEVQQNLDLLKQRTARLHRLLDDLLAYSRAGRKPGEIVDVDTRLLAEDLFVLLAPPETMRLTADESLPVLRAHHAPLEQVLRNLINNAIKHHPTRQGSVRVYAQEKDDEVLFAVEDDGGGIPQEFAEKVFQMFQTLAPRDEVEGSGMGLAIVKRIVEWQGGRIWFHGGPGGRGTVFKFTWKRAPRDGAVKSASDKGDESDGQDREYLAG